MKRGRDEMRQSDGDGDARQFFRANHFKIMTKFWRRKRRRRRTGWRIGGGGICACLFAVVAAVVVRYICED